MAKKKSVSKKSSASKRKTNVRLRVFVAFWAFLLCSFAVAISLQLNRYNELGAEEARLLSLIADEENKTAELKNDMDYYESDAFVEKIAREQLDLLRPDEKLFFNDAKQ